MNLFQKFKSNKKINSLVFLILLAVLINELIFISITPLWQNSDEIEHFAYTYYLAEENKMPILDTNESSHLILTKSDELNLANIMLESDKISFAVFENNQLIHQDFSSAPSHQDIKAQLADIDRSTPGNKIYSPAAVYPPLYYLFEGIGYSLFKNGSIVERAYAMRIIGIVFLLITLFFIYKIARLVTNNKYVIISSVIFAGFLPRFSYTSAGINNDALLIMVSTITIYLLLFFWDKKLDLNKSLLLGIVIGIGLLSKPHYLFLVPFILGFFIYKLIKSKNKISLLVFLTIILVSALLLASSWLIFITSETNTASIGQAEGIISANPDFSPNLSQALYFIIIRYFYLFASFFSLLGCCHEIYIPSILLGLFGLMTAIGIFGYLIKLFEQRKTLFKDDKTTKLLLLACFPILLEFSFLIIFLRQPLLSGVVDFPIDSRYIFPVIGPIVIVVLIGLYKIIPDKLHRISFFSIIYGLILINFIVVVYNLIPRFYL